MADIGQFRKAVREMANYRDLTTGKLLEYEQYFVGQLGSFGNVLQSQIWEQQCQAQIESLRSEIARRSLAEQSERQHRESMRSESWTFWMAVLAVVVPVVLFAISRLHFSKPQPSTTDLGSSPTSQQIQATIAESPEPEASSNSATPSPEPTATSQPSASQPES